MGEREKEKKKERMPVVVWKCINQSGCKGITIRGAKISVEMRNDFEDRNRRRIDGTPD